MIIVHSNESRSTEEQLRDEIEILKAKLHNAELRVAGYRRSIENVLAGLCKSVDRTPEIDLEQLRAARMDKETDSK